MEKRNKKIGYLVIALALLFILSPVYVRAQEVSYCCEKTVDNLWCQNAPEGQCNPNFRMAPTSCEATSYCEPGCCYDSSEGICMESTPESVCDQAGGVWSEGRYCDIEQCQTGCCVLGTQAAFVSLTRCKKLSSFYNLLTDFRRDIDSEFECLSLASLSDEGACVYEIDFIKTCKFATRQECNSMKEETQGNSSVTGEIEFHENHLCSDPELGTNCGPTERTTCVSGDDNVYFVDSCGNIANIYDADRVDDEEGYWSEVIPESEACDGSPNSCGNCDYLGGSICKYYKDVGGAKPEVGEYICSDLDCDSEITSDGEEHEHGESWCTIDNQKYNRESDEWIVPEDTEKVGSRFFRHLCINGEEIIEPCADYRQEICIQDGIDIDRGDRIFSQAACRVNRWEDCYIQNESDECLDNAQRDCSWDSEEEICLPKYAPGFEWWKSEAQDVCGLASSQCTITETDRGLPGTGGSVLSPISQAFGGLLGQGSYDDEEIEGEECKSGGSWRTSRRNTCNLIGDCGAKENYIGKSSGEFEFIETEED